MARARGTLGGMVVLLALTCCGSASADVYWANLDTNTIGRAAGDGTAVNQSFIAGLANRPCGLGLDRGRLYWGHDNASRLGRARRDGTQVDDDFLTTADSTCGAAANATHVFWDNGAGYALGSVGRATIFGTAAQQAFIPNAGYACGVAVTSDHVYWGNWDGSNGTVGRANLNGTGANLSFITGGAGTCGVAVAGGYIFWANNGGTTVGRARLDGSQVDQSFIEGASGPCGVASDGTYLYWANYGGTDTIGRARIDGSEVNHSFITGASSPCGVAVDPPAPGAPVGPSAGTPDEPILSGMRLARRCLPFRKKRQTLRATFDLERADSVVYRVERILGFRATRKCPPSRPHRRRRHRGRTVARGVREAPVVSAAATRHRLKLKVRLRRVGVYRLTLRAKADDGTVSRLRRRYFRVLKPR